MTEFPAFLAMLIKKIVSPALVYTVLLYTIEAFMVL